MFSWWASSTCRSFVRSLLSSCGTNLVGQPASQQASSQPAASQPAFQPASQLAIFDLPKLHSTASKPFILPPSLPSVLFLPTHPPRHCTRHPLPYSSVSSVSSHPPLPPGPPLAKDELEIEVAQRRSNFRENHHPLVLVSLPRPINTNACLVYMF